MSRAIPRKVKTLATVGVRRQALVAEACAAMLAARIRIAARPFAQVARSFGDFTQPDDPRAAARAAATTEAEARIAREVRWAVRAAAPFMPFRSVCLQQAMAAQRMLRRRGIVSVLYFGAQITDAKPIDAHAWLDAAGVKVTGYPLPAGMHAIACFV